MRLKKAHLLLTVVILTVVCTSFASVFAFAAEGAQTVYDENKEVVSVIDGGNYFDSLFEKAKTDDAYYAVMQSVVEVARAYDSFANAYAAADYSAEDFDKIQKIIRQTKQYVTLEAEVGLDYDKERYLTRIVNEKAAADAYVTLNDSFAARLADAKAAVNAKYADLTAVNTANPTGKPETVVGFYDNDGMQRLARNKSDFDSEADDIAADYAAGEKSYLEACDELNACKTYYINLLEGVRKNKVERAADALADYYAVAAGRMEGDAAQYKSDAQRLIRACDSFFSKATPEVLSAYTNEKSSFEKFMADKTIDDSEYAPRSYIESEDGTIKIVAKGESNNELNVFSSKARLKVYNVVETSPKRYNAETAVRKENRQIRVAYFIDLQIYNATEVWDAPSQFEGEDVTYFVTIDLGKYYENYIKNNETFLSGLLSKIGLGNKAGEDKQEAIAACKEYLEGKKGSLCYRYYKDNLDCYAQSLDYSLTGGTLMFETNMLGAFAVTESGSSSLLINPIFWVVSIVALFVIIIILVLLVKYAKYRVVFYSDGKRYTNVRARKGESFVMPKNPEKEGYIFAGWFENKKLTSRFLQTSIKKRKNLKAYAKWVEIVAAVEEETSETKTTTPPTEPAAPVEQPAAPAVAVVDAPAEQPVQPVEEPPVEQPAEPAETPAEPEEPADEPKQVETAPESDEERLARYYTEIRKAAMGYALSAENEKAIEGTMLVRAFNKEDGIYVYFALAAEENGLTPTEGSLAADTPSMMVVATDEDLEKAKAAIDLTMISFGLEKTGAEIGELKEGSSKGFGYRLKFKD